MYIYIYVYIYVYMYTYIYVYTYEYQKVEFSVSGALNCILSWLAVSNRCQQQVCKRITLRCFTLGLAFVVKSM